MIDTLAVIGDSASVGFGTGRRGYATLVAEQLGARRLELAARFGKTVADAVTEDLPTMAVLRPDVVVLQTGMADSLVHPGRGVQRMLERFVPPTWHGVDGLERRALFSDRRSLRLRQKVSSAAKTALKRVLITTTGGWTRMRPGEYGEALETLVAGLEAVAGSVVLVGTFDVDPRLFPGQRASSAVFAAEQAAVLARHPGVVFVRPDEVLRRWDDFLADHLHWNASGHARVASLVVRRLRQARPVPASGPGAHSGGPV